MSFRKHHELIAQGHINPTYDPICAPTSFNIQSSPRYSLTSEFFSDYIHDVNRFPEDAGKPTKGLERFNKKYLTRMARELGGLSFGDYILARADTEAQIGRILTKLHQQDYIVTADIALSNRTIHTVAVIPTDYPREYILRGTWVPKHLKGVVTVAELETFIHREEFVTREDFPISTSNIVALPRVA